MNVRLQRRIASNQAMFREANEAISRGLWPGEEEVPVRFRCECPRVDCQATVQLTLMEYEQVRAEPRRFVVVEGHELPDVEEVVATNTTHLVVEKVGEAGAQAQETDPRS